MRKNIYVPPLAGLLVFCPVVFGSWTLLENFEDGEFPEGTIITNSNPRKDGEHRIVTDPVDSENQADRIVADVSSHIRNSGNFLGMHFPLPEPIEDGVVVTFYHRMLVEGPVDENDVDGPFGFFDANYGFVDVEYDGSWATTDFEVALGYSPLINLQLAIRNADETGQFAPWTPVWSNTNPLTDLNVWYEIWVVIDQGEDVSDVYIRGGPLYPEQTKVVDNARFRNGGSTDPFKYFVVWAHDGNEDTDAGYRGIDPLYLDDLYLDYSGENLSTPSTDGPVDWYGYTIDANGWGLATGWLGWVNVTFDPYIWNLALDKYVYVGDDSGWIYVPK